MQNTNRDDIQKRIAEIEAQMYTSNFWQDSVKAQAILKEYEELKDALLGIGKYDKKNAILSLYAGAGGDDAEDFVRILFVMYQKYIENKQWRMRVLHTHENDHGGYRNLSIEIEGKNAYGNLKHEYGVHRLVRISPFNANKKRHTSFVLVEVLPVIEKVESLDIPESEFDISFARASGAGGQNVNKRETAVRVVHRGTGVSAHIDGERSQHANNENALSIVLAKLERMLHEAHKKTLAELSTDPGKIEWGSQIRSYVLHPYQMIKDHRTNVEVRAIDSVLEQGNIEPFITAMKEKE